MVLESKNKEKRRNKTVLLFSGGMDCLCVNQIFKPDIILFIKYGGKYCKSEFESLKKLIKIKAIDKNKVRVVDIGNWLGKMEREDAIIPNRNTYFITLASEYGEVIYLASIYGDRSCDKDKIFFKKISNLLSHTLQPQHWTEGRKILVKSPVKNLTKTQLIKKFLEHGGDPNWLLTSYSCYSGKDKICLKCKPCIRKVIALYGADITLPKKYFKIKQNKELIAIKDKIVRGEYRGMEDRDICKFMEWNFIGGKQR